MKLIIALFLLYSLAGAKTFTYQQVHSMPTGIEKDYYIWRFLTQRSTNCSQAQQIIKDASQLNKKLRTSYKKKCRVNPKNSQIRGCVERKKQTTKAQRESWLARKKGISFEAFNKKAIHALEKRDETLALAYFQKARALAREQYQADQASFWLYLITKKKAYIRQLLKSWDTNLYTLLARDMVHAKYPKTITPSLPKIDLKYYNASNPIHWTHIKNKIFNSNINLVKFANNFKAEESVGVYSYIRTNASKKREVYYPMPYRNIIGRYPKPRQALLYAIARQESRFVPASVSKSFALGMMQIMPFLIKHIAKERGENLDYDEMFKPQVAIAYANHHLNYLTSYLYTPLFVAYAYNGGIGFTKRLLQDRHYFRAGRYEPLLSMEKMQNVEAREYGKKVLVNFVIYLNKLGISARVTPIIKQLTDPRKTDKFRK